MKTVLPARAQPDVACAATKTHASRTLQRKCACGQSASGGECSECAKKKLQRKPAASAISEPGTAPPIVHEVLQSPGQPLDGGTRSFMEARFGHDFSKVRVHADAKAAESAGAVDAAAYTVGRHVVFGTGQYRPESATGKGLLAHELAHVVQQRHVGDVSTEDALDIGPPHDRFEQEADALAGSMTGNQPMPAFSSVVPPARLQRMSVGEFFSQIPVLGVLLSGRAFGAENYSDEELLRYYTDFVVKGRIENHYDSDNKARAIVKRLVGKKVTFQPANGKPVTKTLGPAEKSALGREMYQGHRSGDDVAQMLKLLRESDASEMPALVSGIGEPLLNLEEETRGFVAQWKAQKNQAPAEKAPSPEQAADVQRYQASLAKHDEQQKRVAELLAGFKMIARGTSPSFSMVLNSIDWIEQDKINLVVLTPTHDSEKRRPKEGNAYFDIRQNMKRDGKGGFTAGKGEYNRVPPAGSEDPGVRYVQKTSELGQASAAPRFQGELQMVPSVFVFLGHAETVTAERLSGTLVHEVQHIASQIGDVAAMECPGVDGVTRLYQTEFLAYWVETSVSEVCLGPWGTGPCPQQRETSAFGTPPPIYGTHDFGSATVDAKPSTKNRSQIGDKERCKKCLPACFDGNDKDLPTGFTSQRQQAIFEHLFTTYPQDQFDCHYVCNADFRKMVHEFGRTDKVRGVKSVRTEGVNLINSIRIEAVTVAAARCTTTMTPADPQVKKLMVAVEQLDFVDATFLKDKTQSNPFWLKLESTLSQAVLKNIRDEVKKIKPLTPKP